MRTKLTAYLTFATMLLGTSSAFALETTSTRIVRIAPWSDNTQVQTDEPNSCNSSKQLKIYTSYASADRNFDVALAAMLSGRKVRIDYSCSGSTARINAIKLYD